jgi:hypothetical protein
MWQVFVLVPRPLVVPFGYEMSSSLCLVENINPGQSFVPMDI